METPETQDTDTERLGRLLNVLCTYAQCTSCAHRVAWYMLKVWLFKVKSLSVLQQWRGQSKVNDVKNFELISHFVLVVLLAAYKTFSFTQVMIKITKTNFFNTLTCWSKHLHVSISFWSRFPKLERWKSSMTLSAI